MTVLEVTISLTAFAIGFVGAWAIREWRSQSSGG